MIIDKTQDFRTKFNQFRKEAQQMQSDSEGVQTNNIKGKHKDDHQFKQQSCQLIFRENIALEYQLSLKYAKGVYLSLSKIEEILKDKKENYFSNAAYSLSSFTNQQRNQFDEQTKAALKMCSDQINQLYTSSEKLTKTNKQSKRHNLIRGTQTYAKHLEEVILCLHQYFKKLQSQFGEFLRYNELKKQKILSTLSIEQQSTHKHQPQYFQKRTSHNKDIQSNESESVNAQLEKEAHLFYIQKIQDQKKAIQTKQTIQSISSMLEEMGKKVLDQQLLTSSFEEIGSVGLSFIDQGNRNLLEANTLAKSAGKYWVLLFLGLSFSLLFVDFLKS